MKIIIRADASPQIGTGHVMRCLALAQAWLEEGNEKVTLLTAALSPALDARLQVEGVQVIYLPDLPTKPIFPGSQCDAEKTVAQAQEAQASWVVVDGYQFGSDYQQTIKAAGLKLLLIDDYGHAKHYCADLVLNQNVYARASLYESRTADTQLLLKTRYALLRKEFWPWQLWRRNVPSTAQKVLVTLGGSDPDNVTLKAIQALQQIETTGLEVTVVVGGSNPHYAQLQSQVQTSLRSSECAITLQRNVTNMPALMAWADVAICAGGGTAWELAFMGLPSLMVILAENQRLVAETMDALGVSINLGWHCFIRPEQLTVQISQLLTQSQKRQRMVANAQNLVDGKGARRLVAALHRQPLRLRRVRHSDCEALWHLANDPSVRANSFSSALIPKADHLKWFQHKLNDTNCHIFVATDAHNQLIGQARFDFQKNNQAEIHISINKDQRGFGYGRQLLLAVTSEVFDSTPVRSVHAFIKAENYASIKLFRSTHFRQLREEIVQGHVSVHFVLKKNSQ